MNETSLARILLALRAREAIQQARSRESREVRDRTARPVGGELQFKLMGAHR